MSSSEQTPIDAAQDAPQRTQPLDPIVSGDAAPGREPAPGQGRGPVLPDGDVVSFGGSAHDSSPVAAHEAAATPEPVVDQMAHHPAGGSDVHEEPATTAQADEQGTVAVDSTSAAGTNEALPQTDATHADSPADVSVDTTSAAATTVGFTEPGQPLTEGGAVVTEPADPTGTAPAVEVTGSFEPYTIGNPGRAFASAVSLTETKHRDAHDIVIDAATVSDPDGTPRLVVRGASSRGLAHQQYGDPRQDDHCTVLSHDGEWLVCLVADGVSAGEWSHLAAKMATEEGGAQIIRLLETHSPAELPYQEVFTHLAGVLADVCATLPDSEPTVDLTPKDVAKRMATTLVIGIVAIRPGEDGTHPVTVVRLGDTSAWILDREDGWIALGEVKNAGNVIAESATACLPLVPQTPPVPVQTTLGAGAALVLMTDGIGDPLGSGSGEVGRELARMWATPPHPLEFAGQVAFGRKTYDDDRGAIVVWPAGAQ